MVEAVIAAIATLAAALGQYLRTRAGRLSHVKTMVDLYEQLPDESTSRNDLLEHIDALVVRTIHEEVTHRRDYQGFGIAIFLGIASGALIWLGFRGGWWWLAAIVGAFLLLVAVAGFATSWPKKERDERGRAAGS